MTMAFGEGVLLMRCCCVVQSFRNCLVDWESYFSVLWKLSWVTEMMRCIKRLKFVSWQVGMELRRNVFCRENVRFLLKARIVQLINLKNVELSSHIFIKCLMIWTGKVSFVLEIMNDIKSIKKLK